MQERIWNNLARNLIIVESPTKAKTIRKMAGSHYKVVATVGHIRDLPKSKLGIDIEDNYQPKYINIRGKGPVIKELKAEAKKPTKYFSQLTRIGKGSHQLAFNPYFGHGSRGQCADFV